MGFLCMVFSRYTVCGFLVQLPELSLRVMYIMCTTLLTVLQTCNMLYYIAVPRVMYDNASFESDYIIAPLIQPNSITNMEAETWL